MELDKELSEFIELFLFEHYRMIRSGLLEARDELAEMRKRMFQDLLAMIKAPECILYKDLNKCITLNETAINVNINDVFKLQTCKIIEWSWI